MDGISLDDLLSPGERRAAAGDRFADVAYGNDTTPLIALAGEPSPSHAGKVMTDRSRSTAYAQFVERARQRNQQRGK